MNTTPFRHSSFIARHYLVALLLTTLAGCGLSQRPPERAFFAIDPGHPATVATTAPATSIAPSDLTLRVLAARVAKPYDSQSFVYKLAPNQFQSDYYNGFIAPPDRMLAGALIEWLNHSGAVKYAVGSASSLDTRYSLELTVPALYADYTNPKSPKAIIEIRAFLFHEGSSGTQILLQNLYQESEPIEAPPAGASSGGVVNGSAAAANNTPANIAAAYSRAYQKILTRLTDDLQKLTP